MRIIAAIRGLFRRERRCVAVDESAGVEPVSQFPRLGFSNKQVLRAGEALTGKLIWSDDTAAQIREVFAIANSWRDSHAYPMRVLRHELIGQIRVQRMRGITAARLKRMPSIRRKLCAHPGKLNQIQDLAGCRAIVPAISDVNALVAALRANSSHELFTEYDYVNEPKSDGYRSHHMVFKFRGKNEGDAYSGRRIELQIRTKLQHSWATAVEAVGLFRKEDMKAGQGDKDWLRLFQLMSFEFAVAEGCSEPPDELAAHHRIREIRDLDRRLNSANTLESLSHAVRFTDGYLMDPRSKPVYYLIRYNTADNTVDVEPYFGTISGVQAYDRAEVLSDSSGDSKLNTVLVEADKIENLKDAYPNYFGDVQLFKRNLKELVRGRSAQEYMLPVQQAIRAKPKERPVNVTWLTRPRRWR